MESKDILGMLIVCTALRSLLKGWENLELSFMDGLQIIANANDRTQSSVRAKQILDQVFFLQRCIYKRVALVY